MRSALRRMGVIAMVLAWSTWPADAHRLQVFATAVGTSIQGKAYFVGGGPAQSVSVSLRDDGDTILAEGRTGSDGRFVIATPVRTTITVLVDAMDGHLARFTIPASRLPDNLPAAPGSKPEAVNIQKDAGSPPASARAEIGGHELEAAIARQIAPLSEEIDALQSALRLRDILGGVGYVVGIFGLFALLKARGRRKPEKPPS